MWMLLSTCCPNHALMLWSMQSNPDCCPDYTAVEYPAQSRLHKDIPSDLITSTDCWHSNPPELEKAILPPACGLLVCKLFQPHTTTMYVCMDLCVHSTYMYIHACMHVGKYPYVCM